MSKMACNLKWELVPELRGRVGHSSLIDFLSKKVSLQLFATVESLSVCDVPYIPSSYVDNYSQFICFITCFVFLSPVCVSTQL